MSSEKAHKVRKASVSFDSSLTGRPAAAMPAAKHGRKLVAAQIPPRFISSASSGISTASTWNIVNKPASSLVALRSRILITIEKAISLISDYQKRYLTNADDDLHGIYQEFVKQLLAKIGHKNDLINTDNLDSVVVKRFKSDPTIARRADFRALAEVCNRAKAFRELRVQVQARIDEVSNYTDTFCSSFASETEGYNFESVENYENIKTECLREITQSMENSQASTEELRNIQPLSIYLESYTRVLHHIEHIVHCLLCVCRNLKQWIIADEQYEQAIAREILCLKHQSKVQAGDRLSSSSLKYEVHARPSNEAGKLRKVDLTVSEYKQAQQKLKEQQRALNKTLEMVRESQRECRRELVEIERQSSRRVRSSELSSLVPMADKVNTQIQRLQMKEDDLVSKIRHLDDRLSASAKEIHLLEEEKSKRKKSTAVIVGHVKEQRTALRQHTEVTHVIAEKLRVLQKLKSLKQDHDVLRKMEFNVINIDYKEAMQAAIRMVAPQVGNSWPDVYLKLPFMPPRSMDKLHLDIKDIQQAGVAASRSATEMAVIAFEKWAKRSTYASVNELLFATKTYRETTAKRDTIRRGKCCVPRVKTRFHQLKIKQDVVYV